jgi:pimeloyl-ACP methyl ester carboxylesterase
MAQVTTASERTNQLSEKDVINVLELVLNEYPIDRASMFLFGHSMGSGGTWYIGGKYRNYWNAIAPMSGPFVQESGYPWDSLRQMSFFVTEGTQAPSLDGSRAVRDWMNKKGFKLKYKEVNADHGGMIKLVLPDIFDFFDSCRTNRVAVSVKRSAPHPNQGSGFSVQYLSPQLLKINLPPLQGAATAIVSIIDIFGRKRYTGTTVTSTCEACVNGIRLPPGVYRVSISTDSRKRCTTFVVAK